MNFIHLLFFVGLILSSSIIMFQDFKEREVSLWILIGFGILCISSVLYNRDIDTLCCNGVAVLFYGGFVWLTLNLYFYFKFKKHQTIINQQLGMADVLVFLFIGLTFNTIGMILFFCFGFVFSLLAFMIYVALKKNANSQSIPLAGLLVFFYVISIIILNLISLNLLIDCSFVLL